ncbi:hypothetical protein DU002_14610 [Corallincola holothuriorum]|uniref:Antitoxin Xre/MbcA/ParS-like toxin-binding domain-containing protein n=1 Tax=Corallincola holothuriorum TaxID=2282215 RepID=A0A368N8T2_9GAMM|nr:hypothetical protein [Corallincola holothuriorum]RCU45689.1 hypothetical protein DU002_14610 [Corallincola holothuriorum]
MTREFSMVYQLLLEAQSDEAAMNALSHHANSEIVSWFSNASISSYGGMTPRTLLGRFGLDELRAYVKFKLEGGFE